MTDYPFTELVQREPYDPDFEVILDEQRRARAEYPNLRRGMQPLDPDDEPSFLGCSSREDAQATKGKGSCDW
jgi:hypothetical protein